MYVPQGQRGSLSLSGAEHLERQRARIVGRRIGHDAPCLARRVWREAAAKEHRWRDREQRRLAQPTSIGCGLGAVENIVEVYQVVALERQLAISKREEEAVRRAAERLGNDGL
eukprot:6533649-Prymnesium_polylepis.1